MTYDVNLGEWSTLPPYRASDFAMAATNNQLALVVLSVMTASKSRILGVWETGTNKWTHPYIGIGRCSDLGG